MPAKRKALGRGLDALLPSVAPAPAAPAAKVVAEIEIDSIVPNPYQPRVSIEDASLGELVESIRSQGVIQPILVRRIDHKFQIVAGERRWRAAKLAEMGQIPAIVVEPTEQEMLGWALLENVQREDLNALEEARAYQTLVQEFGLSQEEIAHRVGKKRSSVANSLRLLKLPPEIQRDIAEGALTAGHGRAVLSVADSTKQRLLRELILKRNLSVRQAELLANRLSKAKAAGGRRKTEADPQLQSLAERLTERLGTKVAIRARGKKRGRIEIHYYGLDDLDRILEQLLGAGSSGASSGM